MCLAINLEFIQGTSPDLFFLFCFNGLDTNVTFSKLIKIQRTIFYIATRDK